MQKIKRQIGGRGNYKKEDCEMSYRRIRSARMMMIIIIMGGGGGGGRVGGAKEREML